jgi:hypothetical protein
VDILKGLDNETRIRQALDFNARRTPGDYIELDETSRVYYNKEPDGETIPYIHQTGPFKYGPVIRESLKQTLHSTQRGWRGYYFEQHGTFYSPFAHDHDDVITWADEGGILNQNKFSNWDLRFEVGLVPGKTGGYVPRFEILVGNYAMCQRKNFPTVELARMQHDILEFSNQISQFYPEYNIVPESGILYLNHPENRKYNSTAPTTMHGFIYILMKNLPGYKK